VTIGNVAAMGLPSVDLTSWSVVTDELPWAPIWEGIELKFLRRGGATGTYTILNRLAPGTVLPRHRHFGDVHGWTFQGRWHYREYEWWATPGSYVYEPPGSVHTLEVPADAGEPAVALFIIQGGLALLDDDGNPWWVEDGPSLYQHYVNALTGRGVDVPDLTLP
jgi:2,4'-dihydroxyacetophenone dioxygenase